MRSFLGYPCLRHLGIALLVVSMGFSAGCKKKQPTDVDGGVAPKKAAHEVPKPRETPEERTMPVAILAPAPLPKGLPLLPHTSPSGKGPKEYVDRAGVRSLLYFHKYAALDAAFDELQKRFEDDPAAEDFVHFAASSFDTSDDGLREPLDAWVAATGSFGAYLSRATYRQAVGWDLRGTRWASDTTKAEMTKMAAAHAEARADAEKAIALRPKLQEGYAILVRIGKSDGDRVSRAALDRAEKSCPTCFRARFAYALGTTPRWGGSYEKLDTFAKALPVDKNPRLATIAGISDYDRALVARSAKKYDDALALLDKATARYDSALFAGERAAVLEGRDDAAALAAADHALDLVPGEPEFLLQRVGIHARAKRWLAAGHDLLDGLRVDRSSAEGRRHHAYVVDWLVWQGWQENLAGKKDVAMDMLELALDLAPTNRVASGTLGRTVLGDAAPATMVSQREADVAAKPDDFRVHRALDYTYAELGRFKDVVAMWDRFIANHPDSGRAYLERGGAKHRLGDRDGATADGKKACDLGVAEGCIRAGRASKTP